MLSASLYILVLSLIIACHSCGSISYFSCSSQNLSEHSMISAPSFQWCFGTSASFATCEGTKAVMRLCRQVHVCRCQKRLVTGPSCANASHRQDQLHHHLTALWYSHGGWFGWFGCDLGKSAKSSALEFRTNNSHCLWPTISPPTSNRLAATLVVTLEMCYILKPSKTENLWY